MMFAMRCNAVLFGLAIAAAPFLAAHAADLVVIEARGVALRAGQTIDSAKPLLLKDGQYLSLISPTGTTIKLEGPYNKAPDEDQSRGTPAAKTLELLMIQRQARVGEVGTTRGLAPNTLPDPWLLDASRTGNVCLREGSDTIFWRPNPAQAADLTVTPNDRSWKADAHWPAGADRVQVMAPVPIRGGATYVVTLDGTKSTMTVASVPAVLSNDAMRVAWLAGKGCEAQAEALLRKGQ